MHELTEQTLTDDGNKNTVDIPDNHTLLGIYRASDDSIRLVYSVVRPASATTIRYTYKLTEPDESETYYTGAEEFKPFLILNSSDRLRVFLISSTTEV